MADYASNTPVSRPIKLKDIEATQDFNGILWSPVIGWMYSPQDSQLPMMPPPPGANG